MYPERDSRSRRQPLNMRGLFRRIHTPVQLLAVSYIKSDTASIFRNNGSNSLDFCFELSGSRQPGSVLFDSVPRSYLCPHVWVQQPGRLFQASPMLPRDTLVFSYHRSAEDFFRNCAIITDPNILNHSFVMTPHMTFLLNEIVVKMEQCTERGMADRLDILSLEFIIESVLNSRTDNPQTSDETNWNLLIDIASYIDSHLDTSFDLDKLCAHFSISRRSLFRYWKKHFNSTPAAYIARRRMQLACHLILNTDLKLFEIVEKCRYGSHAYFCAEFKKQNGLSPFEYRKKYGSG